MEIVQISTIYKQIDAVVTTAKAYMKTTAADLIYLAGFERAPVKDSEADLSFDEAYMTDKGALVFRIRSKRYSNPNQPNTAIYIDFEDWYVENETYESQKKVMNYIKKDLSPKADRILMELLKESIKV